MFLHKNLRCTVPNRTSTLATRSVVFKKRKANSYIEDRNEVDRLVSKPMTRCQRVGDNAFHPDSQVWRPPVSAAIPACRRLAALAMSGILGSKRVSNFRRGIKKLNQETRNSG